MPSKVPRRSRPISTLRARGLGCAVALAALAAPIPALAQDAGGIEVGAAAPAVAAQELSGKSVKLDAGGHAPALIEFWATWCPYCQKLEPRMKAAYRKYGGRVRFYAVAVNVNESPEHVGRYAAAHALPYPILYDASGEATRAYDVPATSFVVITDATGRVAYTGLGDGQELDAALTRVLAAPRTGRSP